MRPLLRQALAEFCIRWSGCSRASAALRQGLPQQRHCVLQRVAINEKCQKMVSFFQSQKLLAAACCCHRK
jgi:hypothetical protein